jgi:Flp pilus assembly protein TadD
VRRGEVQQAKHELETALTYDPEYRTARLILAGLQNHTGAIDAAILNGVRLLQSNPRDLPVQLIYSESLIFKKDYERAGRVLKLATESAPNNADVHRQLGILNLAKNNLAAARKEFRLAWELQPASRELMQDVVLGYVVEGTDRGAIDLLRQMVAARPEDVMLRMELARTYLRRGQHAEAISALQAAMKLEPSNPESEILLAEVYCVDHKAEEALGLLAASTRQTRGDCGPVDSGGHGL